MITAAIIVGIVSLLFIFFPPNPTNSGAAILTLLGIGVAIVALIGSALVLLLALFAALSGAGQG